MVEKNTIPILQHLKLRHCVTFVSMKKIRISEMHLKHLCKKAHFNNVIFAGFFLRYNCCFLVFLLFLKSIICLDLRSFMG